MKPKKSGEFSGRPVWLWSVSLVLMLILFGACSRKTDADAQKPVIFFAPVTISNVPDVYKPLYLGNLSPEKMEAFRAALPYESITLERTSGSGSSPVYRVTLYRSGKAELEAKAFLPKTGEFTGQVDLPTFARLCYVLDSSGFKDFQEKYRADMTDDAACIITVSTGKSRKAVADYGTIGPIQLWAIEQLIDGVRERTDWKLVTK